MNYTFVKDAFIGKMNHWRRQPLYYFENYMKVSSFNKMYLGITHTHKKK